MIKAKVNNVRIIYLPCHMVTPPNRAQYAAVCRFPLATRFVCILFSFFFNKFIFIWFSQSFLLLLFS